MTVGEGNLLRSRTYVLPPIEVRRPCCARPLLRVPRSFSCVRRFCARLLAPPEPPTFTVDVRNSTGRFRAQGVRPIRGTCTTLWVLFSGLSLALERDDNRGTGQSTARPSQPSRCLLSHHGGCCSPAFVRRATDCTTPRYAQIG
jgi:hypothetical protein